MLVRVVAGLLLVLSSRVTGAAAADSASAAIAARIGGQTIAIADVDARCGEKCAALARQIDDRFRQAADALVEQALLAGAPRPTPAARPVSDADVTAYLAAHASEFHGPPARDRAAVRFFLERESARARDRRLIDAARAAGDASRSPTPAATQGDDDVLGRIGDRTIRRADVELRAALALYRLRAELARERLRRLGELIDERLWERAAREQGKTAAALRAAVVSAVPPIGEAEIDRYFATEVLPRDPKAVKNPQRIRPYLEFRARYAAERALLDATRASAGVEITLVEPAPPRFALDPGPGGWRGAAGARHHVLLLTSYRGEASRRAWQTVRALRDRPDVALGIRPLLPQWDPEATTVAAAARCAVAQEPGWALHDALATTAPLPDRGAIAQLAHQHGVDADELLACMDRAQTLDAIAAESADAEKLGIGEPPVVLVDGLVLGAPSPERIDAALAVAAPSGEGLAVSAPSGKGLAVSAPSSQASASP